MSGDRRRRRQQTEPAMMIKISGSWDINFFIQRLQTFFLFLSRF